MKLVTSLVAEDNLDIFCLVHCVRRVRLGLGLQGLSSSAWVSAACFVEYDVAKGNREGFVGHFLSLK